jgi:membrane protease YdiL (CAAX protease family)
VHPTHSKKDIWIEISTFFIAPVILIYLGIIPVEWRVIVLLCVSLILLSIIRHERWTKEMLGLKPIASAHAIVIYTIVTMLGVAALKWFAAVVGFVPLDTFALRARPELTLFFIPLSVLQEIAYRAFLAQRLHSLTDKRMARILINVALFTLLHIIYPFPLIGLTIAAVGGFVFAYLYERYPSIVLICISHSILNFVSVWLGFFTIQ